MKAETDTYRTRIPNLSDSELLDYVYNFSKYRLDAVRIALKELQNRGHTIPDDEINRIEEYFLPSRNESSFFRGLRAWYFQYTAAALLATGLLTSLVLYLSARPTPPNPLGYEPLETKKYLHELQVYGGKANVLATELMQWFDGLWRGQTLSFTIAFITVIVALFFWFLGAHLPAHDETKNGGGKNEDRTGLS
jgi:hypothetical protein